VPQVRENLFVKLLLRLIFHGFHVFCIICLPPGFSREILRPGPPDRGQTDHVGPATGNGLFTTNRSKNCRPSCGSCSCSTRPAWMSRGGSWPCRSSWRGSYSAARKSSASSKRRSPLLPRNSSFIFIKRLFSSSSLSAIRVVSSAYLRLLIFLPAVLIPACNSSSPELLMMYSAYKLNKQGLNIQPWCTPFPIWNQSPPIGLCKSKDK